MPEVSCPKKKAPLEREELTLGTASLPGPRKFLGLFSYT
jgi:hypothetical protein